jgi:hypothetical protein
MTYIRVIQLLAERMLFVGNKIMPDLALACPVTLEILTKDVDRNVSSTQIVLTTRLVFKTNVSILVRERAVEMRYVE